MASGSTVAAAGTARLRRRRAGRRAVARDGCEGARNTVRAPADGAMPHRHAAAAAVRLYRARSVVHLRHRSAVAGRQSTG